MNKNKATNYSSMAILFSNMCCPIEKNIMWDISKSSFEYRLIYYPLIKMQEKWSAYSVILVPDSICYDLFLQESD